MPTALELLSTEACDDILVVDLESRTIIIPKTVSVLGVEADDETRILHFCVPRYYCEVDLSEFSIRINYKNAKGEGDLYIVTDTVIEGDLIKFDWIVGRHAFTKKGNVVFNVCLKDVFEGIVRREFNTTVAILPVLEGLETGTDLVEGHTDIFEQLREDLSSNLEDLANIAVGEYIAEHPDEVKGPKGDAFEYEDFTTQQLEALRGPAGASLQSIRRTAGNGSPGSTDTYTVTMTNGATATFQVYNGKDGSAGSGSGDMLASMYDPQGKRQDIFQYVDNVVGSSGIPNLGENITESSANDTVAFWAEKGSGQAWFSSNDMLVNQPCQYGFVISYVHGTDVFQMFSDQNDGVTYFRYGDGINNWFKHWAKVYDDTCDIGSSGIPNLGENITEGSANDTVAFWAGKGSGQAWFSSMNMLIDQPSEYGILINYAHSTEIFQIFRRMPDGPTYWRSGNANGWNGSWAKVYDSYASEVPTFNADGVLIIESNIEAHYLQGEWLQTTADNHRTNAAEKFAVIDGSGWIYYRTAEEIRSDISVYSKTEVDAAIEAAWASVAKAEEASF